MLFPAISPAQAVQLGVAAQAAGSAAAAAFADLLRSAASLLAPTEGTNAAAVSERDAAQSGSATDLSVLRGQIDSLLTRIADRVRQLFATENRPLPQQGVILAKHSGYVAVSLPGEAGASLPRLVQQDDLLRSLVRALAARRELLDSATSPDASTSPLRLHVKATAANQLP
jgi:hypothetical protein